MPVPLRIAAICVLVLLVALAALPLTMALDQAGTAATVVRRDPSLSPAEVRFGVWAAIGYAAAVHLVYGAVVVWLGIMALRRRGWARIALTVALVLATLGSVDSAAAGTAYVWWVSTTTVLHLVVGYLLWVPGSVRAFFAGAHPRAG